MSFHHTTPDVCPHGQLGRSCDRCEQSARLSTLEAANARLRADLARVTGERDAADTTIRMLADVVLKRGASLAEAVRILRDCYRELDEEMPTSHDAPGMVELREFLAKHPAAATQSTPVLDRNMGCRHDCTCPKHTQSTPTGAKP